MALLGATTHTVTRTTAGSYVDGDYASVTTTFSLRASVQPLTGVDLQRLPEAERQAGRYKLYCKAPLYTSRKEGDELLAADTVSIDGREMRVLTEIDQSRHVSGVAHYKYILGVPDDEDGL